jgi:hypothetical protein
MEAGGHSVRVNVHARDFWCEGDVIVPRPGGYKGRVLDLLNENTRFVALTDVLLHRTGAGALEDPVAYDVLLVRIDAIEFVVPLD